MKTRDGINIPETRREKLRVLKEARAKLAKGFTQKRWFDVIDGTESYCLYGALQAAMGIDHESVIEDSNQFFVDEQVDLFATYDRDVSSCSLTSTLFNAAREAGAVDMDERVKMIIDLDEGNQEKVIRLAKLVWPSANLSDEKLLKIVDESSMDWKVGALQRINDRKGKAAVLEVLDKAIADMERAES